MYRPALASTKLILSLVWLSCIKQWVEENIKLQFRMRLSFEADMRLKSN